jgi:hypothetical protein
MRLLKRYLVRFRAQVKIADLDQSFVCPPLLSTTGRGISGYRR